MTIADQPSSPPEHGVDATPSGPLDTADGIARVMGDRGLYLRMLRRFRDDYQHGAARISAAIGSGDSGLAHRMAHTLKGASGMISARAVHQQASVLELALRNGASGQADAIDLLGAALAEALQAIDLLLAAVAAHAGVPAAPAPQSGRALLARLDALLASGDGAAVDLLEESGASLRAVFGEAGFGEVAQATNEFDFEGALEALRRLADAQGAGAEG